MGRGQHFSEDVQRVVERTVTQVVDRLQERGLRTAMVAAVSVASI